MMMIKVFTMRFSDVIEGFDDEDLRVFMADKDIISFRERFFLKDNIPYWAVMLTYKTALKPRAGIEKSFHSGEEKRDEYISMLSDENIPIFNLLRDWRNERALKEGIPPYVIVTNKQLAAIVSKSPENLNQLSAVAGVGKAKIEKSNPGADRSRGLAP